jgi:hypothetical protein
MELFFWGLINGGGGCCGGGHMKMKNLSISLSSRTVFGCEKVKKADFDSYNSSPSSEDSFLL